MIYKRQSINLPYTHAANIWITCYYRQWAFA